jgi:serine/threonine protein kinase
MITGMPPFYSDNHNIMYRKILYGEVEYPAEMSKTARSIISQLLVRDPKNRLGNGPNDAQDIKKHEFFSDINWDQILKKEIKVPFKPLVKGETDVSNFDPAFTQQQQFSQDTKTDLLSKTVQNEFYGFSFMPVEFSTSFDKKQEFATQ